MLLKRISITLIVIVLGILSKDRFSYALDYELQVLTSECTYQLYVTDRSQCIK